MALFTAWEQYLALRTIRDLFWITEIRNSGCRRCLSQVKCKNNNFDRVEASLPDPGVLKLTGSRCIPSKLSTGGKPSFTLTRNEWAIANFLIKKLKTDATFIVNEVWKHPKKNHINVVQVEDTFMFLEQEGFSRRVIAESPAICFYPVVNIKQGFEEIKKNKTLLDKIGYEDGFIINKSNYLLQPVSVDKRLQLCLYFMELPFDFDGSGIFDISSDQVD